MPVLVNEDFLRQLNEGSLDKTKLLAGVLPARAWHEEKLRTFLSKLADQAKETEAL